MLRLLLFYTSLLLVRWAVLAAEENPSSVEVVLASNLPRLVEEEIVAANLLENVRISKHFAITAVNHGECLTVVSAMRMPKNLSRGDRKEIIRPYLAHELLKLRVLDTTAYQKVLREYKFGAIFREKLLSSLVQSLDGEVRELVLGTRYIHDKEYIIALGIIPNANLKLRAARLLKGKFVELAYLKLLLESLSQKLASEEYGQACAMLFDAKQHGYPDNLDFYFNLYHVFLHTGKAVETAKISSLLSVCFSDEMNSDDCARLAALAKSAGSAVQHEFWRKQEDSRISQDLLFDNFVPQKNK